MKVKKLSKRLYPLTNLNIFYGKSNKLYDSMYACCVPECKEIMNSSICKIVIVSENTLDIYIKEVNI